MENFVVSARKYRPATFDTVVGQEHITTTLKNAIKNNHLAQAFLFCGPRGVGKTTCARILAKTINCQNLTPEGEACNTCDSCKAFNTSSSFNVHELDAASNNSVEDIRSLVEQVRYAPQQGKYKVYIIDEVHMLSNSAFNAFLKTLEEPPSYAIFILATTERHKIIPTILSRCQTFDFNRIRVQDIVGHLASIAQKESIEAEPDALHLIGQKADGALRDALSIFDQMVTFSGTHLTYKDVVNNLHILDYDYYFSMTDHLLDENLPQALLLFDEILKLGFDAHNFIVGLSEHLRGLLVCKDNATIQLLQVSDNIKAKYQQQANRSPLSFLLSGMSLLSQCDIHYKASKNQRLHVELALMKLAHLTSALNFASGQPLTSATPALAKKANGMAPDAAAALPSSPQAAAPQAPVSASPKPNQMPPVNIYETSLVAPEAEVPTAPANGPNGTYPANGAPAAVMASEPEPVAEVNPVHPVPPPVPHPRKPTVQPSLKAIPKLNLKDLQAQLAAPETVAEPVPGMEEAQAAAPGQVLNVALLQHSWNGFAERMKHEGHMDYFMILNQPLQVDEQGLVTLVLTNPVQEFAYNSFRDELIQEMRQKTGFPPLRIRFELREAEDEGRRLYTQQDRFNYLSEKYPVLLEFRDSFHLDMNY